MKALSAVIPRRALTLLVVLSALGGASSASQAVGATSPEVHALTWDRLGVWRGYTLNDLRIVDAHVSERFSTTRPDGSAAPTELAELELSGASGIWRARCRYETVSMDEIDVACDFVPDGGGPALMLVLDGSGGRLLGPVDLAIRPNLVNLEALELQFDRGDSARVAAWEVDIGRVMRREARHPMSLFDWGATAAELEAAALAALVTLLPTPGEMATTTPRLDAYRLGPGEPRVERGQAAALGQLLASGDPRAPLLQRHLAETRRIDREAGALVTREPWTPRVALGLQFGLAAFENGRGGLEAPRIGSIDVQAGLRLDRFLFLVAIGLHPNDVGAHAIGPPGLRLQPDAFGASLGLQGTYALPVFDLLEVVVGARLGLRARFIDFAGEPSGLAQAGLSLAPVVGLQMPVWRMNDLGSRLLFYVYGAPELRLWTDPSGTAPSGRAAEWREIQDEMGRSDVVFRFESGLRLEL